MISLKMFISCIVSPANFLSFPISGSSWNEKTQSILNPINNSGHFQQHLHFYGIITIQRRSTGACTATVGLSTAFQDHKNSSKFSWFSSVCNSTQLNVFSSHQQLPKFLLQDYVFYRVFLYYSIYTMRYSLETLVFDTNVHTIHINFLV